MTPQWKYISNNKEMWQSPVYCNSLENCRVEMLREFESHRFRQILFVCVQSPYVISKTSKTIANVLDVRSSP